VVPHIYTWLVDLWTTLWDNYDPWRDTADIVLVAFGIYWLLMRIKGTRAAQMALGLLMLVLVWRLSDLFGLATLGFLLDNFLSSGLLILIVIFQADIRRALSRVGRGLFAAARTEDPHTIEEIVRAAQMLVQRRIGALVALERHVQLDEFVEAGTRIDAELSRDLLVSLFQPHSPLHDGAVLVRRGRVISAGCILPLTLRGELSAALGTRHRAALGLTEETDAIVVVVSEESARMSLVVGGEIHEDLDAPRLRRALLALTSDGQSAEEGLAPGLEPSQAPSQARM
jgi:diadenylate cyclase